MTAYMKHLSIFHIKCPSSTLKPLPIYGLDFLPPPPPPLKTLFQECSFLSPVSIFLPLLCWVPSVYCYFHQYVLFLPLKESPDLTFPTSCSHLISLLPFAVKQLGMLSSSTSGNPLTPLSLCSNVISIRWSWPSHSNLQPACPNLSSLLFFTHSIYKSII